MVWDKNVYSKNPKQILEVIRLEPFYKIEVAGHCSTHTMTKPEVKMRIKLWKTKEEWIKLITAFYRQIIEVSVIYNSTPPYIALQNLRGIWRKQLFFVEILDRDSICELLFLMNSCPTTNFAILSIIPLKTGTAVPTKM